MLEQLGYNILVMEQPFYERFLESSPDIAEGLKEIYPIKEST